ncbi:low-specificity L-threonine aldolase [Arenicella xantha]|uniref:L-threonine aldolase n=1 Tax=Arenicella xantha TaxID=644221 RepID=A0A395JET7_9GAMM|nr:low-specificity L-threonine aldolase [Arenicella xantha]RBP47129.1 L-threonine aldolase [Arenicella xantha]
MTQAPTIIDLRSDTFTTPCAGMRQAMADAEVGDDVFGEDPTVNRLQSLLAERAGHQAGLFFPSGTQSNLVALLAHCQRGDEYIVGQNAHTYRYEAGGAAVLGSIQPQPIEHEADGTINLSKIEAAIKADDFHFAKSKLLALENTIGGKVIPAAYIADARELADRHDLVFHLDGARVFNAAVAQNTDVDQITRSFDSVSICLSKGLGAPVGSVLVSDKTVIDEARRWRKMVGGGMRQAGILAAAGVYALEHNVAHLHQDHRHAQQLADALMTVQGLTVVDGSAHTNMVFLSCDNGDGSAFLEYCKAQGLLFTGASVARLVFYKDISSGMVERAIKIIRAYFES